MDRIWAPWRLKYIKTGKKTRSCALCIPRKKKSALDRKRYILKRGKFAFSILNLYPYNNGHVMVAPYRHVKNLELLRREESLEIMDIVNHTTRKITKLLKPCGYNIGVNLGAVSGAGLPGHVHVHIVPRWQGDTNFMPVLADTKVIPVSLDAVYDALKD